MKDEKFVLLKGLFFLPICVFFAIFVYPYLFVKKKKVIKKICDFMKNYIFINLSKIIFILFCLFALILFFLIVIPDFFTANVIEKYLLFFNNIKDTGLSNSSSNEDPFSLINPFIALLAATLTFIAFWTQYQANQKMLYDNKKQQAERQFYEMLKIHRDNIDKMEWKILKDETEYDLYTPFSGQLVNFTKELNHIASKGQEVIRLFLNEFLIIHESLKICHAENAFSKAYRIFFEGLDNIFDEIKFSEEELITIRNVQKCVNKGTVDNNFSNILNTRIKNQGRCNVFGGHREVLNPYYRNLFYTVKFVVDSTYFTEIEKKNYLKTLRSQMTSEEQALLFFNWHSGYGSEWECRKKKYNNHFFSTYKMIHNMELKDVKGIYTEESLKKIFVGQYITEKEWDDFFEFNQRRNKFNDN